MSRTRAAVGRHLWAAVALAGVGGCTDGIGPLRAPAPEVLGATVAGNANNVLSVVVRAWTAHADSVAIRFGIEGQELTAATPGAVTVGDSAAVAVLGLLPDTRYTLQVVAFGNHDPPASGDTLAFTTASLPDDLPRFVTTGSDPSPGYVVFATGRYGLVIDNTGRVVWYREFPGGAGLNFQAQPTGRYVALPPPAQPGGPSTWVELDPLGDVTPTLTCAQGLQPRFHDLLIEPDGSRWMLCDETRVLDLAALGGAPEARVIGTVVQHVSAAGGLLFAWNVFDHFELADLPAEELALPVINWTHGNALDLDAAGNLLVSFRNLSEVTNIDTGTGAVIWRMGGVRNQFTFQDVAGVPFARQHGVRATGPGSLMLLDNLGAPGDTRAKRFSYDAATRTARLIASYGSNPPLTGQLGGTTQQLAGGRALVSFGNGGWVAEYDFAGNELWRIVEPGYVIRAQRIHSLYAPGVDSRR